jgi:phosphoglycolate phosphatase
MPKIKLIIFDLDGTLVNAYPAIISSFNCTMRKFARPAQGPLVIRRAVGWGDENLLRPFISQADLKKALRFYRRHHRLSLARQSRLFPQAKEILSRLKNKGFYLAVASNRPTAFSRLLIRHLKIDRFFDYILCADKLKHIKPHPEILKKILKKFALQAKEAIYVADMSIDAQAGRRAGIKTVIVTTGSSNRQEIKRQKPWRIIHQIASLGKVLPRAI